MKKLITIFMACLMAFGLVGCTRLGYENKESSNVKQNADKLFESVLGGEDSSDKNARFTSKDPVNWDAFLEKYNKSSTVNQVVFIKYYGEAPDAECFYYVKDEKEPNGWKLVFECDADIAPNGLDKEKEGDKKTPTGEYNLVSAAGYKPNPGCVLPYTILDDTSMICNDNEATYNRIINSLYEAEKPDGHVCMGTKLYEQKSTYNYAIDIDFNAECKYLGGSGIFLRCKSEKIDYTGGAVAIPEDNLCKILTTITKGAKIVIGSDIQ